MGPRMRQDLRVGAEQPDEGGSPQNSWEKTWQGKEPLLGARRGWCVFSRRGLLWSLGGVEQGVVVVADSTAQAGQGSDPH